MANGRGVRPKRCRHCGKPGELAGVISFRGLCAPCAIERQTFAAIELHEKAGPTYDRWKASMQRAVDNA